MALKLKQKPKETNNLKQNLAFLVKKYNIDNEILAKCTGLSNSTISSLRSRNTNPTILTLQPLAEFFNLTIDELSYQDCSSLKHQDNSSESNNINIPIIQLDQVQNWPYALSYNYSTSPDKFINTTNNISNLCFGVKLNSSVLEPCYKKGTVFIIDPDKQAQDNSIVIISVEDTSPTYRQLFIDSNSYYIKPINPEFGNMQHITNFKIHGVVIRAISEFV